MKNRPFGFEIIVATDLDNGIGRKGSIPWHIPADITKFRDITTFPQQRIPNTVIMGRKTWQSLPTKPLSRRFNIVITQTAEIRDKNVKTVKDFEEALYVASRMESECKTSRTFIIGGQLTYLSAMSHMDQCRYVYLTKVFDTFDCDAFFPKLETNPILTLIDASGVAEFEGLPYQFFTFKGAAK